MTYLFRNNKVFLCIGFHLSLEALKRINLDYVIVIIYSALDLKKQTKKKHAFKYSNNVSNHPRQ